jgi:hypothetical protein
MHYLQIQIIVVHFNKHSYSNGEQTKTKFKVEDSEKKVFELKKIDDLGFILIQIQDVESS